MINPIISGVSTALQTLDQLLGIQPPSAAGAFSTGQTLPAGADASSQGTGPSTPSSQFAPATLGFLTSLQDAGSQAWSNARGALGNDLTNIGDIVNQLQQALNGSAASTSSAQAASLSSTSSAGASALSASTSTALVQSLDQLASTLQNLASLGGHHHHHHHGGDAAASSGSSSDSATGSSTSDAGTSASTSAGATPGAAPST